MQKNPKHKLVDLQQFRREKIGKSSFVKMLLFLFVLGILLSVLYFLFQRISEQKSDEPREQSVPEHRILIDTTGFRS